MKKIVLCLLSIAAATLAFAQTDAIKQYVDTYNEVAMREMMRTGVPAAITLAQGIVESQAGQSDLVKSSNNHFGIKCKEEWTGDRVYHDDDLKNECFRVYNSAEESYRDHSDFLKNRPYYTDLFNIDPADYKAWARGLKKAGYATERDYPETLIRMIEANGLQQYTLIALQRMKQGDNTAYVADNSPANNGDDAAALAPPAATDGPLSNDSTSLNQSVTAPVAAIEPKKSQNEQSYTDAGGKNGYAHGVFVINSRRVVYAKAGTSLLSLADKYDISLSSLLEYNELGKKDILKDDKLIFLQKKLAKGEKEYRIAGKRETLQDIAQIEGVRLESILEYNTIKRGARLSAGQKIYLRPHAVVSSSRHSRPTKADRQAVAIKKKKHKGRNA